MIRAYIAAFFAGLLSIVGAMLYRMGKSDAKNKQTKDDLAATKKAKDTRYELENTDDQRLIDILSGKLRDDR